MKAQDNNKKDNFAKIKEKAQQILVETIILPTGFPVPSRYNKSKKIIQ